MLATTAIGTAGGAGIGYLFSRDRGHTAENVLINGAIGASAGLLAGALLRERNVKIEQEKQVVQREARVIDENQKELDALRERVYDSTSWGRSEKKSFDQRYQIETSELPYQSQ